MSATKTIPAPRAASPQPGVTIEVPELTLNPFQERLAELLRLAPLHSRNVYAADRRLLEAVEKKHGWSGTVDTRSGELDGATAKVLGAVAPAVIAWLAAHPDVDLHGLSGREREAIQRRLFVDAGILGDFLTL